MIDNHKRRHIERILARTISNDRIYLPSPMVNFLPEKRRDYLWDDLSAGKDNEMTCLNCVIFSVANFGSSGKPFDNICSTTRP
ncbi:MAG TPA: hypothetical protein PLL89_04200 [bacterium]|nr:hypothetical protein [bacterium]